MTVNVLEYLEDAAARAPGKIAFADAEGGITYAELKARADAIGTALSDALGGARNAPVYVCIKRDTDSIAAFLGVTASGNFYVPLDLSLPARRARAMLETIPPAAVLAAPGGELTLFDPAVPRLTVSQAAETTPNPARLAEIRARAIDGDPLYAIFTSGSTGVPKGVAVSHRSVIDLCEQFTRTFALDGTRVFGNQAPFDFDVSVKDIYLTLKNAATAEILPRELFSLPERLIAHLNARGVNTLIWAVSAMKLLAALGTFDTCAPEYVRLVMFSGEVLPARVLNVWRAALPDTVFVNLYGPTEITCNCAYYIVDRAFSDGERIPIGRAFRNTELLLTEDGRPVTEPGRPGELWVRGTSLALGYYNAPEATARAFGSISAPYPERAYRTGDLAQYNARGELEFLGRRDAQIKHLGHRIELGEVELAANALPFIEAVCCVHDEARARLVMFYQSASPCDRELMRGLRETLPKYMLPNKLIHSVRLPENRNGKIDRAALRDAARK